MIKKVEYLFPIAILIKALVDIPDLTFVELIDIPESNFNPVKLLQDAHTRDLKTKEQCLAYLGFLMRNVMKLSSSKLLSDVEAGQIFL